GQIHLICVQPYLLEYIRVHVYDHHKLQLCVQQNSGKLLIGETTYELLVCCHHPFLELSSSNDHRRKVLFLNCVPCLPSFLNSIFFYHFNAYYLLRFFLRRPRTINLSDSFLRRVFLPRVGLPHGDNGLGIPIPVLPSPPPCG